MAKKSEVLAEIHETMVNGGVTPQKDLKPSKNTIRTLVHIFDQVDDKRVEGMVDYPLTVIIMTTFLAVLAGANTWSEIEYFGKVKYRWLKKFLPIKGKNMPSHDTYNRVFSLLDTSQLQRVVLNILQENMSTIRKNLQIPEPTGTCHIAIDGKEENGSGRNYLESKGEKIPNMQTLHFYDCTHGIVLAAEAIDRKTNEIPVAQKILETLDIQHALITFDALHTQTKTIHLIRNKHADYIGGLKGNQSDMLEMVTYAFNTIDLKDLSEGKKKTKIAATGKGNTSCLQDIGGEIWGNSVLCTVTKKHDQVETRTVYRIDAPEDKERDAKWDDVKSYIMVVKKVAPTNPEKSPSEEIRYYISSLTDIADIYNGIIGHWAVENNLHWHLDYTYEKDKNTTMNRTALQNLALIMNLCLALQKLAKVIFPRMSLKAARKTFGWNIEESLTQILSTFDDDTLIKTLDNVKLTESQLKRKAAELEKIASEAEI